MAIWFLLLTTDILFVRWEQRLIKVKGVIFRFNTQQQLPHTTTTNQQVNFFSNNQIFHWPETEYKYMASIV